MAYPFQPKLAIDGDTCRKLKIIALSAHIPITKVCEQIIDYVWEQIDKIKLQKAEEELKAKV